MIPLTILLNFGLLYATYRRAFGALRTFTGVPFATPGGHDQPR